MAFLIEVKASGAVDCGSRLLHSLCAVGDIVRCASAKQETLGFLNMLHYASHDGLGPS